MRSVGRGVDESSLYVRNALTDADADVLGDNHTERNTEQHRNHNAIAGSDEQPNANANEHAELDSEYD